MITSPFELSPQKTTTSSVDGVLLTRAVQLPLGDLNMSNSPLPSSFDGNSEFYEENRWQKLSRRLKEEPLIPLGCLLTCAALLGASRSIRAGDHNRTNRMFRARIIAQGFTLVAMVAGSIYWDADRKKRKEFEGVVSERKAKEKQEAWIRELEARDKEEQEMKALREKRRARGKEEIEKIKTKVPENVVKAIEGKVEPVVEKIETVEEKGKGILDRAYGMFGSRPSTGNAEKEEPNPSGKEAKSMVDDCEKRRIGVLDMVQNLVNRKN
ncbi:hypoxia induced protein conserved region-domain-containing protein [Tricladium varicosporioides]|nr:hypoxia induced protein conserved region-domain-containing protein [Hymenoscyphus varicosporioides]